MNLNTEQLIAVMVAINGLMMAFGKHIMPIIMAWFGFKDKETKTAEKVLKLETNHIAHIQEDVKNIRLDIEKVSDEIIKQGNRITRLETKLEK